MRDINTENHTDIKRLAWLETLFSGKIHPYFYAMRLDRPIGIWLLLLPALWSLTLASGGLAGLGLREGYMIVLFILGAVIMRAAGCVINDLWDRDFDLRVERTANRPIASGQIGLRQAFILLGALLALGFIILLQFNLTTILIGFASLPFIILYPLMKRITWWPQAFLGLTFNFGALMGWSAVTGSLSAPAWLLYVGGMFWTLGYDTIYAHQDIEDDIAIGVKSTARLLKTHSKAWISLFFALAFLCWILALLYTGADGLRVWSVFALATGAHFVWQIKTWRPEDQQSSLRFFKANRDAGLLFLLACL